MQPIELIKDIITKEGNITICSLMTRTGLKRTALYYYLQRLKAQHLLDYKDGCIYPRGEDKPLPMDRALDAQVLACLRSDQYQTTAQIAAACGKKKSEVYLALQTLKSFGKAQTSSGGWKIQTDRSPAQKIILETIKKEPLTVAQLAAKMNRSRQHIYQITKTMIGIDLYIDPETHQVFIQPSK